MINCHTCLQLNVLKVVGFSTVLGYMHLTFFSFFLGGGGMVGALLCSERLFSVFNLEGALVGDLMVILNYLVI